MSIIAALVDAVGNVRRDTALLINFLILAALEKSRACVVLDIMHAMLLVEF